MRWTLLGHRAILSFFATTLLLATFPKASVGEGAPAPAEQRLLLPARPASLEPVPLTSDQLQVALDGESARVLGVKDSASPLILLTVFDVVGDLDRVTNARQALVALLDREEQKPWIGVLSTKRGLNVLQAPTRNKKRVVAALDAVNTAGYAALLDTLEDAARVATSMIEESGVRVAILYVTDGSIYEYRADYTSQVINPSDRRDLSRRFRDRVILDRIARIETALQASAAPVFILHLEERTDELNQVYQGGLQRFAAATGGGVEFCRSTADVTQLFGRIAAAIDSFALISLEVPDGLKRRARVELTLGQGGPWLYPTERLLSSGR